MDALPLENTLDMQTSNVVDKIKALGKEKVRFIIFYGSTPRGEQTDRSDIDLAVFYDGDMRERFEFRKNILGNVGNEFDIQTFQDLPLYIQNDIISTGTVIYLRDFKETFNVFMNVIREFNDFKPRLDICLYGLGV